MRRAGATALFALAASLAACVGRGDDLETRGYDLAERARGLAASGRYAEAVLYFEAAAALGVDLGEETTTLARRARAEAAAHRGTAARRARAGSIGAARAAYAAALAADPFDKDALEALRRLSERPRAPASQPDEPAREPEPKPADPAEPDYSGGLLRVLNKGDDVEADPARLILKAPSD